MNGSCQSKYVYEYRLSMLASKAVLGISVSASLRRGSEYSFLDDHT